MIASWLLDLTATSLLQDPVLATVRRPGLRLGRGALDAQGGHRRGRAGPRAQHRALLPLQFPRRGRVCRPAPLGDAVPIRRPPGETGRQVTQVGTVPFRKVQRRRLHADRDSCRCRGDRPRSGCHHRRRGATAVAARGRFIVALSGGQTPWIMLRGLAGEDVPWQRVHVVQVNERVAPLGDLDRNLTHLQEHLIEHAPLRPEQLHAMPVESPDLEAAAALYAQTLGEIAEVPPVLDLVHLGLGPDGHTASLVPGDPVLDVTDADVAMTGVYRGRRRMTLTYPILNRSRRILWLVTGREKAAVLVRLRDGNRSIPAGRICRDQALLLADLAAAGKPGPT